MTMEDPQAALDVAVTVAIDRAERLPADSSESIRPDPISSARERTATALTVWDGPAAVSLKASRKRMSDGCRCRTR